MSNTPSISTLVSTAYMGIKLGTSAIGFAKQYKPGKTVVATHDNASEDSYRVSRSLIPPGFDTELKVLTKAINACRAVFNKHTLTVGRSADGQKADGDKVIPSRVIADGSFMAEWNQALSEFRAAHQAFVYAYPGIVRAIETASYHGQALGNSFDLTEYPDQQAINDGFAVTLEGPFPIADASTLANMPLDRQTREALESQLEAHQRRMLANASQALAKDMAELLSNMATNLNKLRDYHDTPAHARTGKAPAIYESLVTNVQDAVAKARAFAIPETDAGSKLLSIVDTIVDTLNPAALSADYLKSAPYHAGLVADRAAELAQALAGEDWD